MINIINNADTASQVTSKDPVLPKISKFPLLNAGKIAIFVMNILRGEHDRADLGFVNGWATLSKTGTNAIYLKTTYQVVSKTDYGVKVFGTIPLYSPNGPTYGRRGQQFIRSLINSARGIHPNDNSSRAQALRRLHGFEDLDGIRFAARVGVETYQGEPRNVIEQIIEPDDPVYAEVFSTYVKPIATPDVSADVAPVCRPDWGIKS